tara:strand:- start:560 stop:931 length:372 start_codon:yes stop_codon:yes gene_type:complete
MAIKRNLSSPLAASVFDGPGDGKKKRKERREHRKFLKEQHESPVRRRHQKLLDEKIKGTFDVEVDGKSYPVKGKKVVKTRGNKKTTTFKARGGKDTPIRKIKDKVVKKDGKVLKNIKKTKYRP